MIEQLALFAPLFFNIPSRLTYFFLGVALVVFFIKIPFYIFSGSVFYVSQRPFDFIPLIFILVWVYGAVIGVLFGNDTSYVFSNFAGMLFYFSYYVLLFYKLKRKVLLKVLIGASWAMIFISISAYFLKFHILLKDSWLGFIWGSIISGSSTGQPRYYFIPQLTIFSFLALIILSFLEPKKYKDALRQAHLENFHLLPKSFLSKCLALALSLFCLLWLPASKGYMLAGIMLFILLSIVISIRKFLLSNMRKSGSFILSLTLGSAIFLCLVFTDYYSIIENIFSTKDISNAIRYNNFHAIIGDITFEGRGLGAVLSDIRSTDLTYGTELTYVNLFHKFGLMALPLFWAYSYTFLLTLKKINKSRIPIIYPVASLGAMMYVFPAIGNPMLYAPTMVILHCMVLLLIRD